VGIETSAAAASCSCDHPNSARAAFSCLIDTFRIDFPGISVNTFRIECGGYKSVLTGEPAMAQAPLKSDSRAERRYFIGGSDARIIMGDDEAAQLAERHAECAFSRAIKSGSPYLRVYAQAYRGLSHIVAGRLDEAVKDLVDALGFARRRKAGLESEARILADLANAHRLKGEFASAVSVASGAITIATARHARIAECLARIVRAEALRSSRDAGRAAEAMGELNRAEALVQETGAFIYAPLIHAAQKNLAEPTGSPRKFVGAS
jgi:tetratricopeptide (TPR) repeat protein